MTQLLLDLELPVAPTFDNFIVGRNAEALAALRRLTSATADDPSSRCLYLWGEHGSGRSHLMQAIADAVDAPRVDGAAATPELLRASVDGPGRRALIVDDVDAMTAEAQEALFHAINKVRDDAAGVLVVSGRASPRDVVLDAARDDLRSRLAWGLVYQLHRLDDDEKDAALVHRAEDRRFPLTPEVRRYLLTHFSRDLGSLMRMVDALDRHARENQRVVTVPLIREFLQRNIVFPTRDDRVGQLV